MPGTAAIICKHVMENGGKARFAYRAEPVNPDDSGWQILCDLAHELGDAKIVAVDEIKKLVPSTASILDTSPPCAFVFDGEKWTKRENQ